MMGKTDLLQEAENSKGLKPMNSTERKELRNIIKGEFEVLRDTLKEQVHGMKEQSRLTIEAKYAKYQKDADAATIKIKAEAEKLMAKIKVVEEGLLGKGISPAPSSNGGYGYRDNNNGFMGDGESNNFDPLVSKAVKISVWKRWEPTGMKKEIEDAAKDIDNKFRQANLQLNREENNLNKKVALNALQSESAITFLELIPQADELLYLDKATGTAILAALPSGETE